MLEKVFRKAGSGDPKSGNLIRTLGIASMIMWVVALGGAGYALKAKKLPGAVESIAIKQGLLPAKAEKKVSGTETEAREAVAEAPVPAAPAPGLADIPTPEEQDALRQLAEIHYTRGDLEKAVDPLQRLLLAPKRDLALLVMATQVFLGTGFYREADEAARQGLRLAPDRSDLEVAAVTAEYRMGKVDAALKEARDHLREHPAGIDMLVALGTMEVEMGPAYPDYGKSLQAALKLKPAYVPALYLSGRKAQLEGNYRDAEIAFAKAIKLEPRHAKAHGQLGMALYHLHKEVAAETEYRKALALNPKDYNTWFNLGEVNLSFASREAKPAAIKSLRQQAMESYLKAVELNPQHAEAHFRIGVLLNGNGEFKEAVIHLEAAKKLDGSHVPTLLQLAIAYESLKRPDQARACLQKALELDPLDKVVQLKLKKLT
jgi:tetratricopeptide (TPR) repeat protein